VQIDYRQPSVLELFGVQYQYRVPRYQRGYAWTHTEVDDFWDDVSTAGTKGHFLGPVVLHDPQDGESREIIDGQQRITTLQILIALIRDEYMVTYGDPPRSASDPAKLSYAPEQLIFSGILTMDYKFRTGDQNRKVLEEYILRAPGHGDRKWLDDRSDFLRLDKSVRARNKPLIQAWHRLKERLTEWLRKQPDQVTALRQLEESVYKHVQLSVLDVKQLDDAFLLFETLNDRGLRLSAADLLKGHLLSKFDQRHKGDAKALEQASDRWDDLITDLGGRDISGFLRHYLLMDNTNVRKDDVFKLFKDEVKTSGPDRVLNDLTKMGDLYKDFLSPESAPAEFRAVLGDLAGTGVDVARVAVLPARRWAPNPKAFNRFARVAEILAFRWVVVGGNAQVLEGHFQRAANIIKKSAGSQLDVAQQELVNQFPGNAAFREAFARQELGYVYRAAYALRRIENRLVSHPGTILGPADVHLEHIMPKAETPFWANRTNGTVYEELVQGWGNLTLLPAGLNFKVSNEDWSTKAAEYPKTNISLTTDLAPLDDWNYATIALRAMWLAALAVHVWSLDSGLGGVPANFADVVRDPTLLDLYFPAAE
jgi:hypothetical protein